MAHEVKTRKENRINKLLFKYVYMHTFLRNESRMHMTSVVSLYLLYTKIICAIMYTNRFRHSESSTHYGVLRFTNSKSHRNEIAFLYAALNGRLLQMFRDNLSFSPWPL